MVDQFCLPQKILSTIQERILSYFIPHRTPIAMISQTEWIMALKKKLTWLCPLESPAILDPQTRSMGGLFCKEAAAAGAQR